MHLCFSKTNFEINDIQADSQMFGKIAKVVLIYNC